MTPERDSGIDLIAAERARQIGVEGWTPEHDDAHVAGEIAYAAECYVRAAIEVENGLRPLSRPPNWPWEPAAWKPSERDPVRNLTKAGALIAAEIDRLERLDA